MQKITPWLSFDATILGLAVALLAAGRAMTPGRRARRPSGRPC